MIVKAKFKITSNIKGQLVEDERVMTLSPSRIGVGGLLRFEDEDVFQVRKELASLHNVSFGSVRIVQIRRIGPA